MLEIITKLIDFLERHTKDQAKRALYQKLLSDIDHYVFLTTGTVTLRYWRYFVIDEDWFDKVKDGNKTIDEFVNEVGRRIDND